ncbi:hypothetical protein LTR53_003143 [Teratosphaeriaceae sp. CCFEE 6253]|nr:hypothetical protein LTR53_003143 [Teratosphaeriaceae sp. CCFEE 6253]
MSAYTTAAQIMGVTGAACLSGMIASASLISIRAILLAPQDLAVRQWAAIFERGAAAAPPFAGLSAACFGYLAYVSRTASAGSSLPGSLTPAMLYATAACIIPSIVPFTLMIMHPAANLRLLELAGEGFQSEVVSAAEGEVQQLFRKWSMLNYVRAAMAGSGAVLGMAATVTMCGR